MKLSKTNFLICLDCAKNAWLKIHRPEVYKQKALSSFEQNIIDTGNQIDELARGLFPGGVLVESRDDAEYTKKLMENRTPVIYQPVFATERYYAVADIFVFNPEKNVYDLYEVKSSTSTEENGGRKAEDYLIDMAFQKNVLNDLGVEVGTLNLIRLNKEYVRRGELDLKKLFLIENLTDKVNEKLEDVKNKMEGAYELLSNENEPKGHCDCILKGKNSHCTTSWYSNSDLPEYSVHEISRIGTSKKKLAELVDSGIFSIKDVPEDFKLSDNQRRQVDTAQSGKEYIDKKGIVEFLQNWKYPLSFLDYETYPSAVPRYDGYKPYQQITFQFSLHVIDSHESELEHFDFIYTGSGCPDEHFTKALEVHLPKKGSVVVWNQSFEKSRNEEIGQRLLEYHDFMQKVNDRIVDLMIPFYGKTTMYDHPAFKGSASIKYVLPALVPHLSYKNLYIQEGGTASDTWNRIVSGEYSEEDKNVKIQALKDYCHLDTLAMVEIWKVLKSV
ncbi:MAG TPA: hypothetical protein DCX32_04395 [Candidatus Moranbacteria bacterium]|nr:MAG: hypothetical protein UW87_C0002G0015 [Candidatus Moranbacteria bacterium GW2011_GWC2_45_10]KKT95186.1 MAG: hypothetical protein UW95_C0003G0028 [Parcubacteria group bacterium GW2011_GWC1_45_14]HAV11747.1 hypothetical protein [Candidatus Moranbacteria bacterium]